LGTKLPVDGWWKPLYILKVYGKAAKTRQRQLLRRRRIRRFLAALAVYKPERIYVFGSWARSETDSLSDLDVIVIKETSAPFLERLQKIGRSLPYYLGALDLLV
jgi:predicted nucleotidyltransferase